VASPALSMAAVYVGRWQSVGLSSSPAQETVILLMLRSGWV
jgi:hypothetical protein